jgi:polyribonucleotide nucleotidyltransferase
MDAGVPIKNPVAGIAMGRVQEGEEYVLLTDILGLEDFSGDMDFKVTGTTEGMTAIQLDVKDAGLTVAQIAETIERARKARLVVLETMLAAIAEPRKEVSTFAPKINLLHIPVEKIGELIGPGGKNIKNIIATTGAQVDVDDDGTVSISAVSEEELKAATDWVSGITRVVTPGEEFENAEVKRILPFGAFVEFLPGKEGMVHVSQMSTQFVKDPNEVVHLGDKVKVRVMEIDQQGRVNLSMLFGEDAKKPVDRGGHGGGQGGPSFRPHSGGSRSPRPYTPRTDQPAAGSAPRSQHPLARQFQRERTEQQRKDYKKRY